MAIPIDVKLKKLFANLQQIGISEFITTREFKTYLLHENLDETWDSSHHNAETSKIMYSDKLNKVEDYQFGLMMNMFFKESEKDRNSDIGNFILPVLVQFAKWSKKPNDFKNVISCLEKLGVPANELDNFNKDILQIDSEKIKTIHPKLLTSVPNTKKIFIVHGHNSTLQHQVSDVISKILLEPIVLQDQANGGQTIIEKFEKNADVGCAIVLLTADDVGNEIGAQYSQQRARQNVILELGYFIGKLGRTRVIPLYEKGVELPSDFHGVVYELLDDVGRWKFNI